jgi:hypothetical protein
MKHEIVQHGDRFYVYGFGCGPDGLDKEYGSFENGFGSRFAFDTLERAEVAAKIAEISYQNGIAAGIRQIRQALGIRD